MQRPGRVRAFACTVATAVASIAVVVLTGAQPAGAASAFTSTAVNQNGGNCANLPNNSTTNGTQLNQAACNGAGSQNLTFTPVSGTTDQYTVATATAGRCVDVNGASTADNATIIQWTCHTNTNQRIRLVPVTISGTDKTFSLQPVHSGKCVAPAAGSASAGTGLVQLPCSSATSRVWRLAGFVSGGGNPTTPPEKTVRVYWLKPSDVAYDQRWPDGIANVMREAQRYYRQELGKSFTLNTQVVEVVNGDHVKSWYENTPNGSDRYWWSVFNMQEELRRKLSLRASDTRWINVGLISAEGPGAGGGGGGGWVILCQHDADGAAGVNGPMNRWYGGMVHELGHAFGLPDSSSTDGTPMSASFYSYPNTHFSQAQKTQILNGPYGSFLS